MRNLSFRRRKFQRDVSDFKMHVMGVPQIAPEFGVDKELAFRLGPIEPVLAKVDPLLLDPPHLTPEEFEKLVTFVRTC